MFSQRDVLNLQRINNAVSSVEEEVDDGILHPDEAMAFVQTVAPRQQSLMQRQQLAEQQRRDRERSELQEAAALAQGMQHSDALFRARGFEDRIVSRVGPNGDVQEFYEDAPNHVTQVVSSKGTGAGESGGSPGSDDEFKKFLASQKVEHFMPHGLASVLQQTPAQQDVAKGGSDPGGEARGGPGPASERQGPLSHTMTIEQGGRRQEVTYGQDPSSRSGYRMTGSRETDLQGRPIQQPQQDVVEQAVQAGTITPQQVGAWRRQAEMMAGPRPPEFAPDRFGRPQPNPAFTAWSNRVAVTAQKSAEQFARENLAKTKASLSTAEHLRQEAARQAAKAPSAFDLSKQFDITPDRTMKFLEEEEAKLSDKDKLGKEKVGAGKPIHDADGNVVAETTEDTTWAMMPESSREMEAERRVRNRLLRMKGEANTRKPAGQAEAGESPDSPAQQPTGGRGGKPKGRSIADLQKGATADEQELQKRTKLVPPGLPSNFDAQGRQIAPDYFQ